LISEKKEIKAEAIIELEKVFSIEKNDDFVRKDADGNIQYLKIDSELTW
jgi:hypothetical protein